MDLMRKKLDLNALDWRKAPEVERAQRQLGNFETTLAGIEREEINLVRQIDALGSGADAVFNAISESGDLEEFIGQRQALRTQRESLQERLRDVRAVLRAREQLRKDFASVVDRAISVARGARYEKVKAAYCSTVEALAKVLYEAASVNADLDALNCIAGGVAGWPSPWPSLSLSIHSVFGMWLRDAAKLGCRVKEIEEKKVVDSNCPHALYNRRMRRRVEIEAEAEEIRKGDGGRAAAERYRATASVDYE